MTTVDRSFIERNRASTDRIRALARLTDQELLTPVGEHWTVAIMLAHLSLWDRRVLFVLERSLPEGKLVTHEADIYVNDYALPLLAAIPPREALRLAVESAEQLDRRLEECPPELLQEISARFKRWVERSLHRNEHLDEADAALKK